MLLHPLPLVLLLFETVMLKLSKLGLNLLYGVPNRRGTCNRLAAASQVAGVAA